MPVALRNFMIPYEATFEQKPAYVHARGAGERTVENLMRFMKEAYQACVKKGRSRLLLEMRFYGPSLDAASIFRVISDRAPEGAKLEKIAYVETGGGGDLAQSRFAETVAANRGVNVMLFHDTQQAARWLEQ